MAQQSAVYRRRFFWFISVVVACAGNLELPPKPAPGKPPVMPTPVPDPEAPPMTPPTRTQAAEGAVWLNEIHYDNIGEDVGEFVEVAGLIEVNLVGWKVLLYNGRNGKLYDTVGVPALDDGDAGEGGLGFAVIDSFKSGIQNGEKAWLYSCCYFPLSSRTLLSAVSANCFRGVDSRLHLFVKCL